MYQRYYTRSFTFFEYGETSGPCGVAVPPRQPHPATLGISPDTADKALACELVCREWETVNRRYTTNAASKPGWVARG